MENYNNEIFGFGNYTDENNDQISNFNYDSISGLGQSDYENEDLFSTEVENNNNSLFNNYYNEEPINITNEINNVGVNYVENNELVNQFSNEIYNENPFIQNFGMNNNLQGGEVQSVQEGFDNTGVNEEMEDDFFEDFINEPTIGVNVEENVPKMNFDPMTGEPIKPVEFVENLVEQPQVEALPETPVIEEQPTQEFEPFVQPETPSVPEYTQVNEEPEMSEEKIEISDTPIEQLNKLTEYEEDRIEETDINALFDKVSVNFKDASDIFRRNSDLKRKIDTRFEELKKLQSELENARKKQLDEINAYKAEVLDKLTEKKEEIEKRLNVLKESQATFEREKKEFEEYKKKEQDNIDRVQKEVQSAYDDRREELNHIEDVLRKQKDSLDEERSQLSLDRIQYESDKNELANNLLKFNELVNSFTNGVNDIQG